MISEIESYLTVGECVRCGLSKGGREGGVSDQGGRGGGGISEGEWERDVRDLRVAESEGRQRGRRRD